MKIAIIGSGISGLYAAWKLSQKHEVTVQETPPAHCLPLYYMTSC